jgi:hypothetical protein
MEQDNGLTTNSLLEVVWLIVKDDEYELPVFLAESIKEIREYLFISQEEAFRMIADPTKTRFGLKVVEVQYDIEEVI